MKSVNLIFILTLLFCFHSTKVYAVNEPYGAYGLYPQGSTRVSAMGGANVGLSDDTDGIQYNPAGLVMGEWTVDAGGGYSSVYNQEADLNGDGTKDGIPFLYTAYAAAVKSHTFAFGLGVSSPYFTDFSFGVPNGAYTDTRKATLSIFSFDMTVALRLFDELSIGLTQRAQELTERYQFTSTNPATTALDVQAKKQNTYVDAGLMYRHPSKRFGIGFNYSPQTSFILDSASLNAQTNGTNWFRSTVSPERYSVGIFVVPIHSLLFVFDADQYGKPGDCSYVGSELFLPSFQKITVANKVQYVFHGGVEWHAIDTFFWDLKIRSGMYGEPARLVNGDARQHTTGGLSFRTWIFTVSFSADSAPNFLNITAGLGLNFTPLID